MIFLFAAAGICLPSFPGGYLHPRKTKISHPKNGHLSSPKVLFFGRPIILKGQTRALKKQLRGVLFTPREDEHRIEPEAMMIWFRWFSELPLKSILRSLGSVHLPGFFLKRIFFVVALRKAYFGEHFMYVKINCKLQTLGHIFEIRTFLGRTETQKIRKKPGFLAAIFLVVRKWITWNKKRQFPKETAGKGTKTRETWRKKTVDLVRKRFFEGW